MSIATRAANRRLARLPCNRRLLTRRGALPIAMSVGAVPLDSPAHIAQKKHESAAIRLASRLTAACCILLACCLCRALRPMPPSGHSISRRSFGCRPC